MKVINYTIPDFKENARVNRGLIEAIDDGLTAFNEAAYPDPTAAPMTLAIEDAQGKVVGGLTGRSAYGWLKVSTIWVDQSLRGQGWGTQLITLAEQVAKERNCHGIHLDTHGFQAPEFYERLGYQRFGELEKYPDEHSHIYYRKSLDRSR